MWRDVKSVNYKYIEIEFEVNCLNFDTYYLLKYSCVKILKSEGSSRVFSWQSLKCGYDYFCAFKVLANDLRCFFHSRLDMNSVSPEPTPLPLSCSLSFSSTSLQLLFNSIILLLLLSSILFYQFSFSLSHSLSPWFFDLTWVSSTHFFLD